MTPNEMRLAAALLHLAADEYSNHGCNDLESEVIAIMKNMTSVEKKNLLRLGDDWNKGSLELESPEQMDDWILMHTLAIALIETADKTKPPKP